MNRPMTKLEKKLRSDRYEGDQNDFFRLLSNIFENQYPGWTVDRLVCNPTDAINYCQSVQQATGCVFPYELILSSLLNLRKAGKKALYMM